MRRSNLSCSKPMPSHIYDIIHPTCDLVISFLIPKKGLSTFFKVTLHHLNNRFIIVPLNFIFFFLKLEMCLILTLPSIVSEAAIRKIEKTKLKIINFQKKKWISCILDHTKLLRWSLFNVESLEITSTVPLSLTCFSHEYLIGIY